MPLDFDPLDLFPLLDSIEGTYERAKLHSEAVDRFLGFEISEVEKRITDPNLPWVGLDPQVLQTPYSEIRFLLSKLSLKPHSRVVELGSGYSRMAHVLAAHDPEVYYFGVERVSQRAREAQRLIAKWSLPLARVMEEDLFSGAEIPDGEVYFLYDLSARIEDGVRILDRLKSKALHTRITILGRGLATRNLIERHHPWLTEIVQPKHFGNSSLYSSRSELE